MQESSKFYTACHFLLYHCIATSSKLSYYVIFTLYSHVNFLKSITAVWNEQFAVQDQF